VVDESVLRGALSLKVQMVVKIVVTSVTYLLFYFWSTASYEDFGEDEADLRDANELVIAEYAAGCPLLDDTEEALLLRV
jgi:hypothetical protein